MIDWHSHILPKMDDGSRDVAQSATMLGMLAEQGVDTVIATPHFYANDESVASFLERRRQSYRSLAAVTDTAPKILLGAEVRYYQGIRQLEGIKDLRIEGSDLLLLEMPISRWTEYMIRELIALASISDVTIILAHVERYWRLQSRTVWARLAECGILMQANASFFTSWSTRRQALSLLEKGFIQFLGSDCHNVTSRPPRVGEAFERIRKAFGEQFIRQMGEYGHAVLAHQQ